MNGWTQEQRDKAALEVELAYLVMPLTQDWPAERVKAIAVDLACQRSELLEALKSMERLVVELYPGHAEPEPEHFAEYVAVWSAVMSARAAISKAEGK